MIRSELALIDAYDAQIAAIELRLKRSARVDDPVTFGSVQSVPGSGPIRGLILLYEVDQIGRFPEVGNFLSCCMALPLGHRSHRPRCGPTTASKTKLADAAWTGNKPWPRDSILSADASRSRESSEIERFILRDRSGRHGEVSEPSLLRQRPLHRQVKRPDLVKAVWCRSHEGNTVS